jgi:transcriptional regulator with XRE-family HTH domain
MPRHALTKIETSTNRHIGALLRLARERRDWTQERLADRAGLIPAQVQTYETATRTIPACQLLACTRALGIPIATLFDGLEGDTPQVIDTLPGVKAIRLAARLECLTPTQQNAVANVIAAVEAAAPDPIPETNPANAVRGNPVASALTEGHPTTGGHPNPVVAAMQRHLPPRVSPGATMGETTPGSRSDQTRAAIPPQQRRTAKGGR